MLVHSHATHLSSRLLKHVPTASTAPVCLCPRIINHIHSSICTFFVGTSRLLKHTPAASTAPVCLPCAFARALLRPRNHKIHRANRASNVKLQQQVAELTRQNTVFRNAIPRFHARVLNSATLVFLIHIHFAYFNVLNFFTSTRLQYQQKEREVQELASKLMQSHKQVTNIKQHVHQLEQANYALRASQSDRCGSGDWYKSNRPPDVY